MRFFAAVLILFASAVQAADIFPTAGKAVGLVKDDTPGSWAVVSADFSAVDVKEFEGTEDAGYLGCYFEAAPGKYLVIKSGGKKLKTFAVVLGAVAPNPPPGPPPGPDPPPKPDPIPAGPRTILILRESAEDTPALARLYTSLQAGKARTYLKSKGHSAFVLDKDSDNAKVTAWRDALMLPLPAFAILDSKGKVLYKDRLQTNTTDEDILAAVKAWEVDK